MKDKSDIRDVMRAEKDRLRPGASEAKREHAKLVQQVKVMLQRGTEEEVIAVMRRAGLRDGPPEFEEALRIWRENRS